MSLWHNRLDEAQACGDIGAILEFNTTDRVYLPDGNLPPMYLIYFLARKYGHKGFRVLYFSISQGVKELTPPEIKHDGPSPFMEIQGLQEPRQVLAALTRIFRHEDPKVMMIFAYVDHIAPATEGLTAALSPDQMATMETIHGWSQDDDIKATQNFVILISYEEAVHPLITRSGGYQTITIDLPELEARKAFTQFLVKARNDGFDDIGVLQDDLSIEAFARITNGLMLRDIEALLRSAAHHGIPIIKDTVRQRKQGVIEQLSRGLLEVIEPQGGFETVAGAHNAKDLFAALKPIWEQGGQGMPQGTLLVGPPGSGKSHVVLVFAKILGCSLLVMRNLFQGIVGATERNLETVLQIVENLSPCILWIDEIDQAIGQRSTNGSADGGTSERVMARIFEFMGSMRHRGRILFIATTNRPDTLDPALLDRFQVVLPFLHPTQAERTELIPILAQQIGRSIDPGANVARIAAMPELFVITTRALQEIVVTAGMFADQGSGKSERVIKLADLKEAVLDYKPTFNPTEHEFIALKAVEMTSSNRLLPWMNRKGLRKDAQWPPYLDGLIDPNTGRIQYEALYNRIVELQQRLFTDRITR